MHLIFSTLAAMSILGQVSEHEKKGTCDTKLRMISTQPSQNKNCLAQYLQCMYAVIQPDTNMCPFQEPIQVSKAPDRGGDQPCFPVLDEGDVRIRGSGRDLTSSLVGGDPASQFVNLICD